MAQTIGRDVTCISCGYNLRGLSDAGSCPECGTKIADSLADPGPAHRARQRHLGQGAAITAIEYAVLMIALPAAQFIDLDHLAVVAFAIMGLSAVLGAWWVGRAGWVLRSAGLLVLGLYGMAIVIACGVLPAWETNVTAALVVANMAKAGLQIWVLAQAARRPAIPGVASFGPFAFVAAVLVWGLMIAEHWARSQWLDMTLIGVAALSCGGLVAYLLWYFAATRSRNFFGLDFPPAVVLGERSSRVARTRAPLGGA